MNNVTYLHTIYINFQQRAVFDGTLEGLRTKLSQFGINASDLENQVMMGEEIEGDVVDYLFDMDEMACFVLEDDIQGVDEMGVYLHIPGFEEAKWGIQPELEFYGDGAAMMVQGVMTEMGLTAS
jgi:hypothetical protein